MRRSLRGFSVVELVVVLAVAVVGAALLAVVVEPNRRLASVNETLSNLRRMAAGTSSYAADFEGQFWTYSWSANTITPSTFPDLQGPFGDDLSAAAAQATDIVRRRGGLTASQTPRPIGWFPHLLFSHLPLVDYLDEALPAPWVVGPEHERLRAWSGNAAGFLAGSLQPQPNPASGGWRWIFASSYQMPPAFYSEASGVNAVRWASAHNQFQTSAGSTGTMFGRLVSDVAFPSHKAQLFEQYGWSTGPRASFWAFAEQRVPVLAVDGSASVRVSGALNRGWDPSAPTLPRVMATNYVPQAWEPAAPAGVSTLVEGKLLFTRGGLGGRDFDGPEAP